MSRKVLGFIFFVIALQCILSAPATAQNSNGCLATTTWWFVDPIPPGWFILGPYPAPFIFLIAAHTDRCAPPPECPCKPSAAGGGSAGGGGTPVAGPPIFLTTGDTYIEESDVSIPGLGGGLALRRRWNSIWPANEIASSVGLFGPKWRSTYEERVFMGGDNYLKYSRGDGSYWSFGLNTTGAFVVAAPANASATLSQSASNWVLAFQNGEQRQFSLTTGLLTAIIDRNGNTTQLAYDGSNRLVTVSDPASRHLYFNYPSPSSNLVTSVTSDFGTTISYAYDSQGRLSQVTEPDATTISFNYNSQSQITSVTDSNGKVLEAHTYDSSGRGLTSTRANGVESFSIAYP